MDYDELCHMHQMEIDDLYEECVGPIVQYTKGRNRFDGIYKREIVAGGKAPSVFAKRPGTDFGQRRRAVGTVLIDDPYPNRRPPVDCSSYGPLYTYPLKPSLLDLEIPYRTGTGHSFSMLVQLYKIPRDDIPMLTEWEHVALCGDCKGTSGSCPGFSPEFQRIHPNSATHFYVIVTTLDMVWALKYASLNNWVYALTWCDRLTTSYVRRMMKTFSGHTSFGAGSCAGKCKPCAVLNGNKCAKPDKRQHSMEAVGIDCDMLHHMLYGEYLPWCYRGIPAVPSYISRYTGILPLTKNDVDVAGMLKGFLESDWSYRGYVKHIGKKPSDISIYNPELGSHMPVLPDFDEPVKVKIPSGVHKGCSQYMYFIEDALKKRES